MGSRPSSANSNSRSFELLEQASMDTSPKASRKARRSKGSTRKSYTTLKNDLVRFPERDSRRQQKLILLDTSAKGAMESLKQKKEGFAVDPRDRYLGILTLGLQELNARFESCGEGRFVNLIADFVARVTASEANMQSHESGDGSEDVEALCSDRKSCIWGAEMVFLFLFLEELGVNLQLSLDKPFLRTFYREVRSFIPHMCNDHSRTPLVLKTLEDCMSRHAKDGCWVISARNVFTCDQRLTSSQSEHKFHFWGVVLKREWKELQVETVFAEWKRVWESYQNMDLNDWNIHESLRTVWCRKLDEAADLLTALVDAFYVYYPKYERNWLGQEQKRLILEQVKEHKRKRLEAVKSTKDMLEEAAQTFKRTCLADPEA